MGLTEAEDGTVVTERASQPDWGAGSWGAPPAPVTQWVYAGFWWRALAYVIDWFLLMVVGRLIHLVFGPSLTIIYDPSDTSSPAVNVDWIPELHTHTTSHLLWNGGAFYEVLMLLGTVLYFILFECSRFQGTPGKLACGLRVTDLEGQRISIGRAIGRYAAKFVSAAILGIGFLMAGWTLRKQGLHDLMANTLVIRSRRAPRELFVPSR